MRTDRQRGSEAYLPTGGLDASRRNEPEVGVADDRRHLYWRHLATVAVVTAVAQGIVLCTCFLCYSTALQSDCQAAAKREAERILREKFAACEMSSNSVDAQARISRMRRRQPAEINARAGTTTSRPSRRNQRNSQRTSRTHQASPNEFSEFGIHLEFTVPRLESHVYARLRANNRSKEAVEFGYVFSQGRFKPYADRFNGTVRYSFRNWTPAKWFNSTSNGGSALFQYDSNRGSVRVLRSGIYYVYSQIRMYHTDAFSYATMVNDDTVLFKCIEGTNGASAVWHFNSCHLGGVTALKAGDRLWLRDMYGEESDLRDYYVHLDPYLGASSYWGIVRLGHQGT